MNPEQQRRLLEDADRLAARLGPAATPAALDALDDAYLRAVGQLDGTGATLARLKAAKFHLARGDAMHARAWLSDAEQHGQRASHPALRARMRQLGEQCDAALRSGSVMPPALTPPTLQASSPPEAAGWPLGEIVERLRLARITDPESTRMEFFVGEPPLEATVAGVMCRDDRARLGVRDGTTGIMVLVDFGGALADSLAWRRSLAVTPVSVSGHLAGYLGNTLLLSVTNGPYQASPADMGLGVRVTDARCVLLSERKPPESTAPERTLPEHKKPDGKRIERKRPEREL